MGRPLPPGCEFFSDDDWARYDAALEYERRYRAYRGQFPSSLTDEHSEPGFLRRAKYLYRLAERYARFEHKRGRNPAGEITLAHLEEAIRLVEGEPRSPPVVEAAELAEAAR